jgi:OOP family OmpA-OmpF porin
MNKRYLLATAAIAVLASAGQAQAKDFYISVLGGANWWEDQTQVSGDNTTVIHFDADTGFIVAGAVGLHLDNWLHGLRVEAEASYRRNEIDGPWATSDTETGTVIGHVSTFAVMANVWYDIDIGSRFKPYIGGGAGWARSHFDGAILTSSGATRSGEGTTAFDQAGFAYQLGAGFNYEIMPGVDLGLGYRFSVEPRLHFKEGGEFGGEGFGGEGYTLDNHNHSVALTLMIDID